MEERKEDTSAPEIHMAACLRNLEEMPVQSLRRLCPLGVAEGQVRSPTVERWQEKCEKSTRNITMSMCSQFPCLCPKDRQEEAPQQDPAAQLTLPL